MMNLIDDQELVEMLTGAGRILIGVSGGADSMALLHVILRNRQKINSDFKVLHVNHQLNPQSKHWVRVVRDYCELNHMPFECVQVDVSQWGKNEEQAARKARYHAFTQQDFDTLLLAHHANDQMETFFLKLFRGSGAKGLRCMSKKAPCWFDMTKTVVRPLLSVRRSDIEDYVTANGIPYVTDPSNDDLRYDRNWIRHELIPLLEERNTAADINILRSVEFQAEVYALMSDLGEIDRKTCTRTDGNLDWDKVRQLGLARIKNLVMHICASHNLVDVSTHHVEQFAKGLLSANMDSRNELRLKDFSIKKIGKTLYVIANGIN
jgi:tRNA(Ile)-lysidine synthase